jgi:hypothetical protein
MRGGEAKEIPIFENRPSSACPGVVPGAAPLYPRLVFVSFAIFCEDDSSAEPAKDQGTFAQKVRRSQAKGESLLT